MPSQPPTFSPSDVVILVTGSVGSGRSTDPSQKMTVGDPGSLSTCTKKVQCAVLDLKDSSQCKKDYRLVLVDTPGFNDGDKPDSAILHDITNWIQHSFPDGRCRGGVIYLHDISADRAQATAEVDLRALDAAFNTNTSKQLIVATTKWNCVTTAEGETRYNALKRRWNNIQAGSDLYKFKGEADAWNIISDFLPQIENGSEIDLRKEFKGMQEKRERRESVTGGKRDASFRTLARLFSRFLVNV